MRQSTDQQLINHFYVTGHESYRIRQNNAKYWPLYRSRSYKVTNFGTNRKPIYDFLLLINRPTNSLPFPWLIIGQIFASNGWSLHFNAILGVIPCEYPYT